MAKLFKKKKKAAPDPEPEATAEKRGLPTPVIGKASAKATAAHSKRFGTSVPTILGAGTAAGFGETGLFYAGRQGITDPKRRKVIPTLLRAGGATAARAPGAAVGGAAGGGIDSRLTQLR